MSLRSALRLAMFITVAHPGTGCSASAATSSATRSADPGDATATASAAPSSAPPAPAAPAAPRPLDAQLAGWEKERPTASTLSEQNGASIECRDGTYATLTLLYAAAQKVKIESEADLVALARWARHPDPCMRQIALQAIVPAVDFDRNQLVVPSMHDVEHHLFHDIFVSLRARLESKGAAYDHTIFAGMMLESDEASVVRSLRGKWIEDSGSKGFQVFVDFGDEDLAVTEKHVPVDPKWPDDTWTTRLAPGKLDARGRYVVTGPWGFERHGTTDNPRQSPSPFVYSFWPVARDIVWFKNGESAYWIKLRRG